MQFRAAFFGLFALGAGCSLIDTSNLASTSAAPAATVSVDASFPTQDAADNGAAPSADSGDPGQLGTAFDATVDAGQGSDAGDGGDAGFCALHASHTFCADFDDGAYDKGWSYSFSQSRQTLALDPSTFKSPPSSLLAMLTDDGGTSVENAQLLRTVPCSAVHIHEEFDMFLQTTGTVESEQSITEINSIAEDETSAGFEIALVDDGVYVVGATRPEAGTQATTTKLPLPFSLQGGWLHVTFDVVVGDATSGRISVSVTGDSGNMASFSQNLDTTSADCDALVVVIGPDSEPNGVGDPTQPMTINYDNVTIDVE